MYEGRAAALHGAADDVVAVLGADFTLAYFHRLLWETLPFCPERSREVNLMSNQLERGPRPYPKGSMAPPNQVHGSTQGVHYLNLSLRGPTE